MKKGISYSLLFITLFLFQSLLHGENLFIYKENESKIFKKNESNTKTSGGIGFFGLLTVLFIGLKLGKVIDWSWFWVLSPILIPFSITIAILAVAFVIAAIMYSLDK